MISVSFRFDDPSPTSDHTLERGIINILSRHGLSACFAVIPFRMSESGERIKWTVDLARHLIDAQQAGTIEIAQHGHTHSNLGTTQAGAPSEFYGIPSAEQLSAIEEGLVHLESIFGKAIMGFVPPWNTYDCVTSQAIGEVGLGFLSASWEIYQGGEVTIIPRTCTLRNARSTIDAARRFGSLNPAVVVVFHPDDFEEFHMPPAPGESPPFINLGEFEDLLKWLRSESGIKVEQLSQLAERSRSGYPLWCLESYSWLKRIPYRIRKRIPKNILIQRSRFASLREIMKLVILKDRD